MQSGQVSVWVALGVAVLGIAGVIAGQLVSAWREDRRWQRELHREDLRWEREHDREREEREHDARMHWKEQRLECYAQLHDALLAWFLRWAQARTEVDPDAPLSAERNAQLLECLVAIRSASLRVELVGSPAVVERCKKVNRLVDKQRHQVKHLDQKPELVSDDDLQDFLDMEVRWLVDDFRADLGVVGMVSDAEIEANRTLQERVDNDYANRNAAEAEVSNEGL